MSLWFPPTAPTNANTKMSRGAIGKHKSNEKQVRPQHEWQHRINFHEYWDESDLEWYKKDIKAIEQVIMNFLQQTNERKRCKLYKKSPNRNYIGDNNRNRKNMKVKCGFSSRTKETEDRVVKWKMYSFWLPKENILLGMIMHTLIPTLRSKREVKSLNSRPAWWT